MFKGRVMRFGCQPSREGKAKEAAVVAAPVGKVVA